MSILEINDLTSGYGEVQILWGTNLNIEEGNLTSLEKPLCCEPLWGRSNLGVALSPSKEKISASFHLIKKPS